MRNESDTLRIFEAERPKLFGVAYRMLGSVREAEDVLQDAWIRWSGADEEKVRNPAAYLLRTVTRLCIDTLKAARTRRLEYVGPWLPEPLVEESVDLHHEDPATLHALAADLSTAFLLMLERLGPAERAVFLLREAFDMSYRDIGEVVGKSEAACRQIERRAKLRLAEGGRPRAADPAEHDRLLAGFLDATREGDVDGLLALLSEDVVAYGDGGGKVAAARNPVTGADRVARFMVGLAAKYLDADAEFRLARVNGRRGILLFLGGRLDSVTTVHVENGRIRRLFTVRNPDKLPEIR